MPKVRSIFHCHLIFYRPNDWFIKLMWNKKVFILLWFSVTLLQSKTTQQKAIKEELWESLKPRLEQMNIVSLMVTTVIAVLLCCLLIWCCLWDGFVSFCLFFWWHSVGDDNVKYFAAKSCISCIMQLTSIFHLTVLISWILHPFATKSSVFQPAKLSSWPWWHHYDVFVNSIYKQKFTCKIGIKCKFN